MKNNHRCIDCQKPIKNFYAKRCSSCATKGVNNPFYGKKHTKKTKRLISLHHADVRGKNSPSYGIKRLDLSLRNKLNPMKGNKNSNFGNHKLAGKNNPNFGKRYNGMTRIDKHHIDLNHKNEQLSNILYLRAPKHIQLHQRAYEYLVRIGKIKYYLKWFDKNIN